MIFRRAKSQYMMLFFVILTNSLTAGAVTRANLGGETGGGGGDPDVIEFMQLGWRFQSWLKTNSVPSVQVTAPEVETVLSGLQKSLDSVKKGEPAKISVTQNKVYDQNHVEKAAYFDRGAGTILINNFQGRWDHATSQAKYNLVMTELLGLCGSEKRYTDVLMISILNGSESGAPASGDRNFLCGMSVTDNSIVTSAVPDLNLGQATRDYVEEGANVKMCSLGKYKGTLVAVFPDGYRVFLLYDTSK